VELLDNKFKLTIIKNTNEIIKEEIKHIDCIHNEPEQGEPKEEPEPNETINNIITLEKFKDILEAKIEKENTDKTYFRTA
jgi:hypothetical protein